MIELQATKGRLRLTMTAIRLDCGAQIILTGGESHIGAMALAAPDGNMQIAERQGHREGELAGEIAQTLATGLCCDIAVSCGIHYDAITRPEIEDVIALSRLLAGRMTTALSGNDPDAKM